VMTDELRARLDAMTTEALLEIVQRRDTDEWREEVFPIVEDLLRARGVDPTVVSAGADTQEAYGPGDLTSVGTYSTALEANLSRWPSPTRA
jgi:hypothetical protein